MSEADLSAGLIYDLKQPFLPLVCKLAASRIEHLDAEIERLRMELAASRIEHLDAEIERLRMDRGRAESWKLDFDAAQIDLANVRAATIEECVTVVEQHCDDYGRNPETLVHRIRALKEQK